jgi:hypothetical protein
MPKLKPSEKEASRRVVRACISNNMSLYATDDSFVALKLGVTTQTVRNKRAKPETLTLGELWDMSKTLKLTPIQAASIALGRPLTSKEVKEFIML